MLLGKLKRLPILETASSRYLARPFDGKAPTKVVLAYCNNSLAWAQFYPFLYFRRRFERQGFEFRAVEWDGLRSTRLLDDASALFFQSCYEPAPGQLEDMLSWAMSVRPDIPVSYFDWSAASDIRFSGPVAPFVSAYVKKTLLRDPSMYVQPPEGHTHLVDYFAARYGVNNPAADWTIDPAIIDRLVLGPAFSTGHRLLPLFERPEPPCASKRKIDVSGRVETGGTPWYSQMRTEAAAAVAKLDGFSVTIGLIGRRGFMRELCSAKMCFSPFGYGEVCIRDFEAVAAGAVLLKPDMSHLKTDPDIFIPWETYVPVKWDFSDLGEKVRHVAADGALRQRLATNAFARVRSHLQGNSLERMLAKLTARQPVSG